MKKLRIINSLIILFLVNAYALSTIVLEFNNFETTNKVGGNGLQIKVGGIHDPINISGNNNFTLSNGVSSGVGTFENPYIIRDLIIDGNESSDCIFINNTNVFFKIQNCTLKNSGLCTIKFNNVSNGWIHDNDISLAGIFLFSSHNNTISNNILLDCNEIYIGFSDNNKILNNYIENSTVGIKFISSNDNIIEANEIYDCNDNSIEISFASNNSIIRNNYIYNNGNKTGEDQIDIDGDCFGTVISGNIYAYRSVGVEFPWLLILIILIIITSSIGISVSTVFLYRRHQKQMEYKHPKSSEPIDTSDLW